MVGRSVVPMIIMCMSVFTSVVYAPWPDLLSSVMHDGEELLYHHYSPCIAPTAGLHSLGLSATHRVAGPIDC